jgi:hypothetical protein
MTKATLRAFDCAVRDRCGNSACLSGFGNSETHAEDAEVDLCEHSVRAL